MIPSMPLDTSASFTGIVAQSATCLPALSTGMQALLSTPSPVCENLLVLSHVHLASQDMLHAVLGCSQLVKVCSPYSLVAAKLGRECTTDSTGLTAMHAMSTKPPSAEEEEAPASELLCKEAAICPVAGEDSAVMAGPS